MLLGSLKHRQWNRSDKHHGATANGENNAKRQNRQDEENIGTPV
jgi:hypothetical protein